MPLNSKLLKFPKIIIYQFNLNNINYQLYPQFRQLLKYPQNLKLLNCPKSVKLPKYPYRSTVTRIQPTATGSSGYTLLAELSPTVEVVTSQAR